MREMALFWTLKIKMKNRYIKAIILISLLGLASLANEAETGFDLSYFPILGISFDSKNEALAGISAGAKFTGSEASPASEAFITRKTAYISFRQHILDMKGGAAFFASPIKQYGVISISLQYLSVGSFDGILADEYNNPIEGDIKPYSAALSFSWSRVFKEHYAMGIKFKYIYDKLSDDLNSDINSNTLKAIAFDLAIQNRIKDDRLVYGILIKNLGTVVYATDNLDEGPLPTSFSAGISYAPSRVKETVLAAELEKPLEDFIKLKLALDIDIYNSQFFFRAGVDAINAGKRVANLINVEEDTYPVTDWSIITLGIGIKSTDKFRRAISVDSSIELRANGLPPGANVSLTFGI